MAVTVAAPVVVSVVLASPLAFVLTLEDCRCPAVAEKATGTPLSAPPFSSSTSAVSVTVPPVLGTVAGSARSVTVFAAAPPTLMLTVAPSGAAVSVPEPVDGPVAAPESAVTVAIPDCVPATNLTVTLPFSVRVSDGSTWPSVAVNETSVPFCTGVPEPSMTVATTSTDPFSGTVGAADIWMVDSVGAVSGILSQAPPAITRTASAATRTRPPAENQRAIIQIQA